MIKKAVLLAIILVALSLGSAFADQIDSLASSTGPVPPTQVYVNPGGLGDALIYGYYNVRGGYQTFFSVTNTDGTFGARVRLRFREAATLTQVKGGPTIPGCDNGSQEVLDFDICLSKNDMWSGQLLANATGTTLLGRDTDTFVQVGDTPATDIGIFTTMFPSGVAFKFGADNLNITGDQTREGYFEIIYEDQLTDLCGAKSPNPAAPITCTCGDLIDTGTPVDNVLMGHTYIVNTGTTAMFAYAATAIADLATGDLRSPINSNRPNFRDDNETGVSDITPVNYALTKSQIMAIYDIQSSIAGKADLIVNFPTKWATHIDTFNSTTDKCDATPADIFDDTTVKVTIWDDKENAPTITCQFSPCTTPTPVELPDEVNIVDINTSGIFTSDVIVPVATAFDFGWININLVNNGSASSPVSPQHVTEFPAGSGNITRGLPVIGYSVETFAGGKFSGLIPLQYKSSVATGATLPENPSPEE